MRAAAGAQGGMASPGAEKPGRARDGAASSDLSPDDPCSAGQCATGADEAGKRGATTLQGLGMVVNQAVIGIKYWTGVDVDAKDLNDELLRVLGLA